MTPVLAWCVIGCGCVAGIESLILAVSSPDPAKVPQAGGCGHVLSW